MQLKIEEEILLEREIDVNGLIKVLKKESKVGDPGRRGATVTVDKNLLKDAALVIEKLLGIPEYEEVAEMLEENERLKDTIVKLEEQVEGCTRTFEDSMKVNKELMEKCNNLEYEKETLKKMLGNKTSYEVPKVKLDETKEARDKVEIIKLGISNAPDLELLDAITGILLNRLDL